jgi:CDP-diacylglycerol---serine O-phosphatidyltransferase
MRKHIPNFITTINLFCGCCALVCVFNELFFWAFIFLLIAGIADYADGMAARLLNVKSPMGKELDSLADMVSFGLVPGAIIYMLLTKAPLEIESDFPVKWWALAGFIITVFSALRLARFNLDDRQTDDFIGLNTPACTMFVTGLMLIYAFDTKGLGSLVIQPIFLYSVVVLFSFLLVVEIPMFSFKFKGMKWQGNESRIVFMILAILLLIFLKEIAFSLIILLYILYSLTRYFIFKNS